jgi:hypothetical protein
LLKLLAVIRAEVFYFFGEFLRGRQAFLSPRGTMIRIRGKKRAVLF